MTFSWKIQYDVVWEVWYNYLSFLVHKLVRTQKSKTGKLQEFEKNSGNLRKLKVLPTRLGFYCRKTSKNKPEVLSYAHKWSVSLNLVTRDSGILKSFTGFYALLIANLEIEKDFCSCHPQPAQEGLLTRLTRVWYGDPENELVSNTDITQQSVLTRCGLKSVSPFIFSCFNKLTNFQFVKTCT